MAARTERPSPSVLGTPGHAVAHMFLHGFPSHGSTENLHSLLPFLSIQRQLLRYISQRARLSYEKNMC